MGLITEVMPMILRFDESVAPPMVVPGFSSN